MKRINLLEVQFLSFELAQKLLRFNEPIPDFETRFPNVLESCLAVPFQKFDQKEAYRKLIGKASMLFYLMIKNHPFANGNKRIAMTTLLIFLLKNNKWLNVNNQELYNFAMWVAQSPSSLSDEVVMGIKKFLKARLVNAR